jgi:hypothetical protein
MVEIIVGYISDADIRSIAWLDATWNDLSWYMVNPPEGVKDRKKFSNVYYPSKPWKHDDMMCIQLSLSELRTARQCLKEASKSYEGGVGLVPLICLSMFSISIVEDEEVNLNFHSFESKNADLRPYFVNQTCDELMKSVSLHSLVIIHIYTNVSILHHSFTCSACTRTQLQHPR